MARIAILAVVVVCLLASAYSCGHLDGYDKGLQDGVGIANSVYASR